MKISALESKKHTSGKYISVADFIKKTEGNSVDKVLHFIKKLLKSSGEAKMTLDQACLYIEETDDKIANSCKLAKLDDTYYSLSITSFETVRNTFICCKVIDNKIILDHSSHEIGKPDRSYDYYAIGHLFYQLATNITDRTIINPDIIEEIKKKASKYNFFAISPGLKSDNVEIIADFMFTAFIYHIALLNLIKSLKDKHNVFQLVNDYNIYKNDVINCSLSYPVINEHVEKIFEIVESHSHKIDIPDDIAKILCYTINYSVINRGFMINNL